MKLELHITTIRDVAFGRHTYVENGCLYIDRDELTRLIQSSKRFGQVNIELARPGEKCRIVRVLDAIEPRFKEGGGNLGTRLLAGENRTRVLRGAAVVLSDYTGEKTATISKESYDYIIDMAGPGRAVSPYGNMCNIVLLATPGPGATKAEYLSALKSAGLELGAYLAAAAVNVPPDDVEVYELPALSEVAADCGKLPKVAFIAQILSLQFEPLPGESVLFGDQAGGIIPSLVHPNQVIDGAVTSPLPALNVQTYMFQNNPVINGLYALHGRELCFVGVILMAAPNNVPDCERMADIAAALTKWVVGADGAVLTKTGGGAPELTMALTAQKCEKLGIKTAIALLHMGADVRDFKYSASTIFSMPELDALVSMGVPYDELVLSPVEKLIGRAEPFLKEEISVKIGSVLGAMCQLGSSRLRAVRY